MACGQSRATRASPAESIVGDTPTCSLTSGSHTAQLRLEGTHRIAAIRCLTRTYPRAIATGGVGVRGCAAFTTMLWLASGGGVMAKPDLSLEELLRRHREAVDGIHTVSCNIDVEDHGGKTRTGSYKKSGNDIRITSQSGGLLHEVLVRGTVVTSLSKVVDQFDRGKTGAITTVNDGIEYSKCDYWQRFFLSHKLINENKFVTLDELVRNAVKVFGPNASSYDRKQLLVVELDLSKPAKFSFKCNVRLYFDAAVNYLVRRADVELTLPNGDIAKRVGVVERFLEAKPAVFCPVNVRQTLGMNSGQPTPLNSAWVSNLVVNDPIPSSVFRLTLPHGVHLRNLTEGTRYLADSAGKAITSPVVDTTDTLGAVRPGAPGGRAWAMWAIAATVATFAVFAFGSRWFRRRHR